jgi:F-type H+-transporting ATPase subunit c
MKGMKIINKAMSIVGSAAFVSLATTAAAFAEEAVTAKSPMGPIGAGLAIGLAVIGGALGQGKAVGSMLESFGRNPSVGGKLLVPMLIGMALIESLVILAFVVALRAA